MEKLIKFYDDLTNSEKEIFDYIFNHQDEVKNMKIMDLAKKILVSKTLIINMTGSKDADMSIISWFTFW